ncbi:MAG: hypothetical protein GY788_15310 [bacterium]|nr:hypothetical protein [bacterium]
MASGSVTITNAVDGAAEFLEFSAGVVPRSPFPGTAPRRCCLLVVATIVTYEACLASVAYENISERPTKSLARTVEFTVNDGLVDSATRISTVSVAAVDDSPVAVENGQRRQPITSPK